MTPAEKTIHDLLVQRRHQLGLSQRTAATMMGMTQSQLSDLESERRDSHIVSTYAKWASALTDEFGFYVVVNGNFETIRCTGGDAYQDDSSL